MDNLAWLDDSREEILTKLATTAVLSRHTRGLRKSAYDLSGLGTQLKGYAKQLPAEAIGGLGGAAIGAGLGGLTSMGQDPEERTTGSNMLTGALAGGALGLGGTMAARHAGLLGEGPAQKFPRQQTTLSDGTVIEIPANKSPLEVRQEWDKLQPGGVENAAMATKNFAGRHPVVATTAAADAITGGIRGLGNAVNPGSSLSPGQFSANLQKLITNKTPVEGATAADLAALLTHAKQPNTLQDALLRARQGAVPFPNQPALKGITPQVIKNIQATGGGGGTTLSSLLDILRHWRGKPQTSLVGTGWKANPGGWGFTPSPGVLGAINRASTSATPLSPRASRLTRGGMYGAALAAPEVWQAVQDYMQGRTLTQQRDAFKSRYAPQ